MRPHCSRLNEGNGVQNNLREMPPFSIEMKDLLDLFLNSKSHIFMDVIYSFTMIHDFLEARIRDELRVTDTRRTPLRQSS